MITPPMIGSHTLRNRSSLLAAAGVALGVGWGVLIGVCMVIGRVLRGFEAVFASFGGVFASFGGGLGYFGGGLGVWRGIIAVFFFFFDDFDIDFEREIYMIFFF
jgi:hypothetical protein